MKQSKSFYFYTRPNTIIVGANFVLICFPLRALASIFLSHIVFLHNVYTNNIQVNFYFWLVFRCRQKQAHFSPMAISLFFQILHLSFSVSVLCTTEIKTSVTVVLPTSWLRPLELRSVTKLEIHGYSPHVLLQRLELLLIN